MASSVAADRSAILFCASSWAIGFHSIFLVIGALALDTFDETEDFKLVVEAFVWREAVLGFLAVTACFDGTGGAYSS